MKLIFRFLFSLISAVLLLTIAVILFITLTATGLRLTLEVINHFTDQSVTVEKIEGNLLTHIEIRGFHYQKQQHQINFKKLELHWHPLQLLRRRLNIEKLNGDGIQFNWQSDSENDIDTKKSKPYYGLLNQIILHDVNLTNISLYISKHIDAIDIKHFKASINTEKKQYSLDTLIRQNDAVVNFKGSWDKKLNLQWNISVPQLAHLIPNYYGSIQSSGMLQSDEHHYRFDTQTQVKDFRWGSVAIKRIKLTSFGSTRGQQQIKLVLNHQQQELTMHLTGSLIKNGWQAFIKTFSITHHQKQIPFLLDKAKLVISWQKPDWQLYITNVSRPLQTLKFHLKLPKVGWNKLLSGKQTVLGSLALQGSDAHTLSPFLPMLTRLNASYTLKALLTGSLNQLLYSAQLQIRNGMAKLDVLGLSFTNIEITGNVDTEGNTKINGSLQVDKKSLQFSAQGKISTLHQQLQAKLQGKNIPVINTDEYQVFVTPQLELDWRDKLLTIKGAIHIPRARIAPHDFSQTREPSSDIVIVDNHKTQAGKGLPFKISSTINLTLGDNVELDIAGLTGHVVGTLTIRDEEGRQTTSTGELKIVGGKFKGFGQELKIREGRLLYVGSRIDNPTLRFSAVRQLDFDSAQFAGEQCQSFTSALGSIQRVAITTQMITVGVRVSGTIEKQNVSLFAEPAQFSQSDILSMLVLGQPICQVKDDQSQLLISSLSALNFDGGTLAQLQNQLAHTFGLDELSISPVTARIGEDGKRKTGAQVTLGKALSPRLFVSFIYNAVTAEQVLRIKYRLWKQLSVRSQSSNHDNAVDFIYTFEVSSPNIE